MSLASSLARVSSPEVSEMRSDMMLLDWVVGL